MLKCYICHDDLCHTLNQICKCNESLLCDDCLIEINNDNNKIQKKCAICKQKLNLKYIRNYNFYDYLIRYLSYNLFIFVINISFPTLVFFNNINVISYGDTVNIANSYSIFLYLITILSILALKESVIILSINYMRINTEERIKYFYFRYNIINSFTNLIFGLIVIFGEPNKIFLFYYSLVFFINYLIPLIIIAFLLKIDWFLKNISDINFKYTKKNLRVLKKVNNNEQIELFNI